MSAITHNGADGLKKIGVLTYYYNSINFGGNLQAYALCKKLEALGYPAEQICFDATVKPLPASFGETVRRTLSSARRCVYKTLNARRNRRSNAIVRDRKKAFEVFNREMTPHSEAVYTVRNIADTNALYRCFIAGSDQIWNLNWYVPSYFLDFVSPENVKTSYAASFGITSFTPEQKATLKEHLRDYRKISLREPTPLGEEIFGGTPEVLADPTLLLTEEEWSAVAAPRQVAEDYVFCYFFGDGQKSRALAQQYAREKGITLVMIPHLNGENPLDISFGDVQIAACSPQQFLSLIKHAECVFTDSFHAVVFSYIFKKNFFVFKRGERDNMSSRIDSITKLFAAQDRFCHSEDRMSMEYICSILPKDYTAENRPLKELLARSEAYLRDIGKLGVEK